MRGQGPACGRSTRVPLGQARSSGLRQLPRLGPPRVHRTYNSDDVDRRALLSPTYSANNYWNNTEETEIYEAWTPPSAERRNSQPPVIPQTKTPVERPHAFRLMLQSQWKSRLTTRKTSENSRLFVVKNGHSNVNTKLRNCHLQRKHHPSQRTTHTKFYSHLNRLHNTTSRLCNRQQLPANQLRLHNRRQRNHHR